MGLFDFQQNNLNTDALPTSEAIRKGAGPLQALEINPYSLDVLKYPQEVGQPDAPHFVRFDINLPNSSRYFTNGTSSLANTQSSAQINADIYAKNGGAINMTSGDIGAASIIGGVVSASSGISGGFGSTLGQFVGGAAKTGVAGLVTKNTDISIEPKTTRTRSSISLYMPDTVVTSYDHDWNAVSLTQALGKLGLYSAYGADLKKAGLKNSIEALISDNPTYNNVKSLTELKGTIAQATGQVGADFTTFALKNQGLAVNPHLEMVFQGTQNRRYIFTFDFQPRSQKEALNIRKILQTFRAYAAPEIANGSNGRYFIPPAEFDISYRFMNVENQYIARLSTCALTNIAINWNQAGAWASFVDGNPVHINVQLTFMEIDIITREMIAALNY